MSQVRNPKIDENTLVLINDDNLEIYINLARSYEAEFSNLTRKLPNEKGIFEPNTMPNHPYVGYLLYNKKSPIGFCVAEISAQINDIAEFYIIPSMRKNKFGHGLASAVFEMYPGKWEVRQIDGAESAKAFWRNVISTYTQDQFQEEIVNDPDWGIVTRQQFISNIKKISDDKQISHANDLSLHSIFTNLIYQTNTTETPIVSDPKP